MSGKNALIRSQIGVFASKELKIWPPSPLRTYQTVPYYKK